MGELADRLNVMLPERRLYTLQTLPTHLAEAEQTEHLRQALTTFDFLRAKVDSLGPGSLINDYQYSNERGLQLIRSALRLSAHILVKDPLQLAGHLCGRLLSYWDQDTGIRTLLGQIKQWKDVPWLCPLVPNLMSPDEPLLCVLEGHTSEVNAVAVTPDGRWAVSASSDQTIRLWDLQSGATLTTFNGDDNFTSCTMTPDGHTVLAGDAFGRVHIFRLKGI
jgi:WD40 repeat protein